MQSCAEPTPAPASEGLIYGGSAVEGAKWSSAVALRMGGALCTGTVVTPTLVITAAHCLDGLAESTPVSVIVGNRAAGGTTYRGEAFAVSPDYRDDALTDIAYVKLSEPVRDVEIIPVLTDADEIRTLLAPGTKSVLVGFGQTESGTIGVKHETTTVVGPSQGGALFVGGDGKDSCQGDSGGPAYGQLPSGEWRVYGITSRGNGCGGGGLLARMHDGLCWIQKDSGIAVPRSRLKCEGVPDQPEDASLSLLLAESPTDDLSKADTAIASAKSVATVGLCLGDLASCRASRSIDVAYEKASKSTADRNFFTSRSALTLRDALVVTLLGFDESGALVASQALSLTRG